MENSLSHCQLIIEGVGEVYTAFIDIYFIQGASRLLFIEKGNQGMVWD